MNPIVGRDPEPLSVEEMMEMQAIQLKRILINAEDQAFGRKLALNHGLDIKDIGKTWGVDGAVLVHMNQDVPETPQKLAEVPKADESEKSEAA